jgi:hypothetical protein
VELAAGKDHRDQGKLIRLSSGKGSTVTRLIMVVLWPSFLVAIVAEGFFFSLFDPSDLTFDGEHIELPALGVYTLGFFFFWAFCALASMLTCYLLEVKNTRKATL